MRHNYGLRKFSRTAAHRQAMFRNLATALLERERVQTTVEKAKDLRPIVEKLITMGRVDSVANRRHAYGYINSKAVVHKLFADLGPRYKTRPGGYTRIIRTDYRKGDAAQLAVIELIADGKRPAAKSIAPSKGESKSAAKPEVAAKKSAKKQEGEKETAEKKPVKKAAAKETADKVKADGKKTATRKKTKKEE
jgi:large subunit ribosomal protein L17